MKKHLTWLILLLMATITCDAQQLNNIEQSFTLYQHHNPTEKLYTHTDKSFYMAGELLWFKLYTVDATTNKPFNLSKVAYVDVLDASNNAVMQAKIALDKGAGSGSFYIPLTLQNGTYLLRAYTSWMKNTGADYYFQKAITIANPLRASEAAQAKSVQSAYDIQFFPEGGDLIRNLTSKVAFKVTNNDGKGVVFKGAVINQHNDTIVRFSPLQFGMGSFVFTPVAGNTYRAVVQVPGARPVYQSLPPVKNDGYVMQVTDAKSNIYINVSSSATALQPLYCFSHSHQNVVDAQNINLINGKAQVVISKSKLTEGINHITLFNSNRQPVAERLCFKRPTKKLTITATTSQQTYAIRQAVHLDIASSVDNHQLSAADLSVSVYRADSLQQSETGNIQSYLWLSSELRGLIEAPAYYFEHTDARTDEALDNLLLTQGWRRFNWNNVLSNKSTVTYLPEYAGHLVAGILTDSVSGKPAAGIITYLGIPGKQAELYASRSDSAGRLLFETKGFYGAKEVILQTNTRHDSTYHIDLQSPFSEQYANAVLPAFKINGAAAKDLEDYSLSMQLQNTYTGNKLKNYYAPAVDSSSFYGKPYKSYNLDDFTRFTTMEEVLREYVTDISVTSRQKHFHIRALDGTTYLDDEPLVLLDGIPVFDMDKAFRIDPLKVKRLELVRNRYFYGPALFEGIMSFTTYKGDLGGFEIDPRAVILDYEGMQLQRQFYSPVYGTAQQVNSRLPDFRNVLYWAPNVGTNAQGKGNLQFYTSDLPGRYVICIEGLTANGEAGSQQVFFEVKK